MRPSDSTSTACPSDRTSIAISPCSSNTRRAPSARAWTVNRTVWPSSSATSRVSDTPPASPRTRKPDSLVHAEAALAPIGGSASISNAAAARASRACGRIGAQPSGKASSMKRVVARPSAKIGFSSASIEKRDRRRGSEDRKVAKAGDELGAGDLARLARGDRLCEQGIVEQGHFGARRDAAIDADRRRLAISDDAAAIGPKVLVGPFRRDPRLDRVAALAYAVLQDRQPVSPTAIRICHSTRSRPVIASVTGCSTWRRVFISRNQGSSSPLLEDELDRAEIVVADGAGQRDGALEQLGADLAVAGSAPALPRAASGYCAGPSSRARTDGRHCRACRRRSALPDVAAAAPAFRSAATDRRRPPRASRRASVERRRQVRAVARPAHALAAAAGRGLDHQRKADRVAPPRAGVASTGRRRA